MEKKAYTEILTINNATISSLSHGIPMFTSKKACKKYLDQLSEFQKIKESRKSLVPRYLEFIDN